MKKEIYLNISHIILYYVVFHTVPIFFLYGRDQNYHKIYDL